MTRLGQRSQEHQKRVDNGKNRPGNNQQANNKNRTEDNTRRIAVVDNFKDKLDIDGDGKGDISHGDLCCIFLKQSNPDAKIDRLDVSGGGSFGGHDSAKLFDKLSQIANKGNNYYDGVSLSQSAEQAYGNGPLTADNLKNYKSQINQEVKNDQEYGGIINKLEEIAGNGTPVYTSSGNKSDIFDYYSAAEGVTSVGAEYIEGTNKDKYSVNSLTDKLSNGEFTSYDVITQGGKDTGRVLGLDITGDGKVDVPVSMLSGKGKVFNKPSWLSDPSSSIATPRALGEDTKNSPRQSQSSSTGNIVESHRQKDQQRFEQEYQRQKNDPVVNRDLDDGIKIDDNIDEWDRL